MLSVLYIRDSEGAMDSRRTFSVHSMVMCMFSWWISALQSEHAHERTRCVVLRTISPRKSSGLRYPRNCYTLLIVTTYIPVLSAFYWWRRREPFCLLTLCSAGHDEKWLHRAETCPQSIHKITQALNIKFWQEGFELICLHTANFYTFAKTLSAVVF